MLDKYSLTPVELELMEILWQLGRGTVRDVMAHLASDRALAYTSVSTILRILQQKQILTAEKMGKHHVYIPTYGKQIYAAHSVKKMVKQIFSNNPVELVAYLMDKNDLSMDEVSAIQKLIDAKKKGISS